MREDHLCEHGDVVAKHRELGGAFCECAPPRTGGLKAGQDQVCREAGSRCLRRWRTRPPMAMPDAEVMIDGVRGSFSRIDSCALCAVCRAGRSTRRAGRSERGSMRSEEHTSELQSLTNLLCRLLLEK